MFVLNIQNRKYSMNYTNPSVLIDLNQFDSIISIGNKCPTTGILKELNIYKESFPFDYIPSTPKLILKYLKDQTDFYPQKYSVENVDGIWFGHFDVNDNYDKTIETFQRRFKRLFELLENKKKILFVYTSESDIYNEMNHRYNDNYSDLINIVDYITETYLYNDFKIMAIHTNKSYIDTTNIINYTIHVPDHYLSDDGSTHIYPVFTEYRTILNRFMKEIFIS